jgi:hypothetical protein
VINPSQGRYLHTEHKQNTFMPRVGFEPNIPVFERSMTVHALDRAATVMGQRAHTLDNLGQPSTRNTAIYANLLVFLGL